MMPPLLRRTTWWPVIGSRSRPAPAASPKQPRRSIDCCRPAEPRWSFGGRAAGGVRTATGGQGVLGFSFRVHQGAHSVRDVRIAEVTALDLQIRTGRCWRTGPRSRCRSSVRAATEEPSAEGEPSSSTKARESLMDSNPWYSDDDFLGDITDRLVPSGVRRVARKRRQCLSGRGTKLF